MATQKRIEELPENYQELRDSILVGSPTFLNALVGRIIYGITDAKKLCTIPHYTSFEKIMEVASLLRTGISVSYTWPLSITENLKTVTKDRAYVAGFGLHAYEIECGPHGGNLNDEALWWETEAKMKAIAYGPTPEIALLRACLLLALQHSFSNKQMQTVS